MKTNSQRSFASRLARADKMQKLVAGFHAYAPGEESLTADGFRELITNLQDIQSRHSDTQYAFGEAVKARILVYSKNPDCMAKIVTLVKSYVRAKYKADSQQFYVVEKLVNNIRGLKPIKITRESTVETISRSERSYGAQSENFSDIILRVQGFGESYNPANPAIKLDELQVLKAKVTDVNDVATARFAAFKPKIKQRQEGFNLLADTARDIKDMVMSQYGIKSSEYNLIKGFEFTRS